MAFRKIIKDSEGGQKYVTEQEEELVFDQNPTKGSFNPVTSDGVKKGIDESSEQTKTDIEKVFQEGTSEHNKLVNESSLESALSEVEAGVSSINEKIPSSASTINKMVTEQDLQEAQDSWQSGFTPKGESTVSALNDLTTQSNGDQYIVTDSGTLTDGSLAVTAGETVAWDGTNEVWYKVNQYALKKYGTDEIRNLPDKNEGYLVLNDGNGLGKFDIKTIFDNLAPAFDPMRTENDPYIAYKDSCVYEGELYECITDHYGPWVAAHFARTNADSGIDYCKVNIDGGYYTDKHYTASQISEGIMIDGADIVYREVNYFNTDVDAIKVIYKNSNGESISQIDNIARGESGFFEIVINNTAVVKILFYRAGSGIMLTALELIKKTDGVKAEVERVSEKLSFYKKEFIGEDLYLGEDDCFEQCVFKTCRIFLNNGVVLKRCDFVNTILQQSSFTLSNVKIVNCEFIGRNARIFGNCMESFEIVGNEFPPSSERYPDAVPKTKGEFSRNIVANTINNCRIVMNHIYIGRTGICILGKNDTRNNSCNCSSRYNVIASNIIEGIGEEHISFDGGAYNDGASIVSVDSVTFEWVSTGQMIDNGGEESDQTKLVARVTLELESCVDVKNAKQYPNFKGINVIALKNSLHYELDTFELVGSTLVDAEDGLTYSVDGRYRVSFLVPTKYNYKDTVSQADKDALEQKIRLDFAINDIVSIAAVQSDNVISGNIINGIGTDRSYDIEDMGGIVLYGMCFSNAITNNVLRQKRIWLESFNRKKNVKMSSNNVIANNTLDETCISLLTWITDPLLPSDAKLMQGNTICNNVVAGSFDVAVVDIRSTLNTTLIGNSSKTWTLKNNDGLKLVANRTVEPVIFSNNTNVTRDATDELQNV